MSKAKIGIGFLVIGYETASEISRLAKEASQQIPEGRALFIIWRASGRWEKTCQLRQ